MRSKIIIAIILVLFMAAFKTTTPKLFSVPEDWPKPSYDFSRNQLTIEKIRIGRALFYDPILSRNSSISCASCHSPYNAFAHVDHALSHGIHDSIGKRNAPALMNLAWQQSFMWDGAIHHLDVQALAPISNPDEMDESIGHVVNKLQQSTGYKKLFFQAYRDTLITGEKMLKCLSQFMLTLVSANARYDSVMKHQAEFTSQENRGYDLFKKNCAVCHTEPLFTNNQFENNGLLPDAYLNDSGRYAITHQADDLYKFKVPTLRNIEFTYPYMHDGRFKHLSEVLNHYSTKLKGPTLSKPLRDGLVLDSKDKVDLIAFLLTLTDKTFLFNKNYQFPHDNIKPFEN